MRLIPGDVVSLMVTECGYASDEEELRKSLGLHLPFHAQYWNYLMGAFRLDLGFSLWSGERVWSEIARRFPISFELAIMAILWTFVMGIPVGVISALKQDTAKDYFLRSFAIAGLSIPGFWIATIIMVFGAIWFKWVPPMGYIPFARDPLRNLLQLLVPSLVLAVALSASVMRMTRAMMLEVMREDYIRTARAKGLSGWSIVTRHALKNALIPVISISGVQLGVLVGGTVVMESIFVLPGMGKFLLDAILWRDYPVIQGINLFLATLIVFINLLVDLMYGILDPRIRYR